MKQKIKENQISFRILNKNLKKLKIYGTMEMVKRENTIRRMRVAVGKESESSERNTSKSEESKVL